MYLQVQKEPQKEQCRKRYGGYSIEKDGILMHGNRIYILQDAREEDCDDMRVTKDKGCDENNDSNRTKGSH